MKYFVFFVALFGLSSCEGILNIDLVGDGNRVEVNRITSPYNEIELLDDFIVEISNSSLRSITVIADANLIPYIYTTVEKGRLTISRKDNVNLIPRKPIVVQLNVSNLLQIENFGSGNIVIDSLSYDMLTITSLGINKLSANYLNVEELSVSAQGGANIKINGDFQTLLYRQVGSGESLVSGTTTNLSLIQEGSGVVDAYNLRSDSTRVYLFGSGLVYCRAKNNLFANIKGNGRVFYKGFPFIQTDISGEGSLVNDNLLLITHK
jgi:hypothetical protein